MYKILLINFVFCQCALAWSPLSYFSKKQYEETIQKEVPFESDGELVIKNVNGKVIVKTWKQEMMQIKITKKATKEEFLPDADVKIKASETEVVIQVKQKKQSEGKVDVIIEVIVPEQTEVNIVQKKGPIIIRNLKGPAKTRTEQGHIEIAGVKGAIVASTDYGSIKINNGPEDIRAHTLNGNITIDQVTKNIVARAKKGTISTTCKNTESLETVSLSTKSGNIVLTLPEKVSAELLAKTRKGKITSEHLITIKPQTTQLNKKTWSRMRKEVDGTLGNGDATIKLTAGSGNIKINKAA